MAVEIGNGCDYCVVRWSQILLLAAWSEFITEKQYFVLIGWIREEFPIKLDHIDEFDTTEACV